ncbi:MAG: hypothetical protein GTO44_10025 [Hydrotalea flava]|nr:hypothetical protein [Hydrotalea flava]NIN15390.1 hypothetical protein [Hydrotalea flava]
MPAEIQAQVDKLEKQKQQKIQQLETKAASLQKTLERQQEQLRTGELRSTRPVNRTLQSIQNVANQIPQTTANFDRQISFAKQQQTLAQQEQQRVQQAFASLDERFGPRQQTTLPRSVQKLANPIDARIRQLQKNIRVQGDIVKKFEIQKQINSLSIQRETLLRKEAQRFQQAFETERQFKLATSRQQARAEGIKQSEVRAIAASQGVAVGTIGTSQAGNQIANIVTPKGETKEVVLPKASC